MHLCEFVSVGGLPNQGKAASANFRRRLVNLASNWEAATSRVKSRSSFRLVREYESMG